MIVNHASTLKRRMRLIPFSSVLLLSASAAAQNWCPPGAVWNHRYAGCFGCNDTGYVRTVYSGDSVIQGSTCQMLDITIHGWSIDSGIYSEQALGSVITRGQEDLVEKWNGTTYDTLYHFAAVPGDSWDLIGLGWGIVTVLDTGHALVDGLSLRYLVIDHGDPSTDTVFARTGFLRYYLDGHSIFFQDTGLGDLRCYKDNEIDFSTGTGPACDFTLATGERKINEHCRLYPNPGSDEILLDLGSEVTDATISVTDLQGRTLKVVRSTSSITRIATSSWPAGLYFVHTTTPNGTGSDLRWIKQQL